MMETVYESVGQVIQNLSGGGKIDMTLIVMKMVLIAMSNGFLIQMEM